MPPTQAYELVCDGAAILITMIAAADDDLDALDSELDAAAIASQNASKVAKLKLGNGAKGALFGDDDEEEDDDSSAKAALSQAVASKPGGAINPGAPIAKASDFFGEDDNDDDIDELFSPVGAAKAGKVAAAPAKPAAAGGSGLFDADEDDSDDGLFE